MRIGYIIPDVSYGGLQEVCINICNFLCERNEVYLISLCEYKGDTVRLTTLDSRVIFISFDKQKGLNLKLIWLLYKRLKMLKLDILHTHAIGLFYSMLYILTYPMSKIFYTLHSPADKDAPFYYRIFYSFLFKFFKVKAIPISKAVRESFKRVYKMECGRVMYHGVKMDSDRSVNETVIKEVERYKESDSTKVFVNIARIAEEKNQYLLIESFNRLMKEKSDILLLIIGSVEHNELLNKLKKLAGSNIYFLGAKNNVEDYLKLVDAFCLTSVYEGLSLATIEALAMKVIPICTPVGGIPEVVKDGYNGILSEDCTVESYVKALKRFLAMSEQEKQVMRENAFLTYKERFTIERCGEEYLKLYNAALREEL